MEIKQLNSKQLDEFIASSTYQNLPNLPISRIRAISHCANPRAEAGDKLLFLAIENEEMLGYFGMLSDWIYLNGKAEKVGWMSCLWIDPKTRGKGVAKALIETALEAWEDRMMVTEFTPEAGKLYQKLGIFQELAVSKGLRIYDLAKWDIWLLRKMPKLGHISPLLKGFAFLTKPFFRLFAYFPSLRDLESMQINPLVFIPLKEIDPETNDFITTKNKNTLFRRTEKELNWLTHFPWIRSAVVSEDTDNGESEAKKYHFSSQATLFRQTWWQVRQKESNKIVACFMLSLRDDVLKTPYFFAEKEYIAPTAQWILQYMYDNRASVLLTFQPELVAYFQKNRAVNRYIRPAFRHYWLSKKFSLVEISHFEIQDGDGDCAFT